MSARRQFRTLAVCNAKNIQHFNCSRSSRQPWRLWTRRTLLIALLWPCAAGHADVPFGGGQAIDAVFSGAKAVVCADLDGDGDLDALGASASGNDVVWWENTAGDGSAWSLHVIDNAAAGAGSVTFGDVDRDGDLDVLATAGSADSIYWYDNLAGDGLSWTRRTVDAAFGGAVAARLADVDHDGDLDVIATAGSDDDVSWFENVNGDGLTWSEHSLNNNFSGAANVFPADLDGDGDIDILGGSTGPLGKIIWWENLNGDGLSWTEWTIRNNVLVASCPLAAADFDHDGDLDVLGAGVFVTTDLAVWENLDGSGGSWTTHTIVTNLPGGFAVHVGDVDFDGDIDVAGVDTFAGTVSWWENVTGDAATWQSHAIAGGFGGAASVVLGDLDGDGDADVVAAAEGDGEVSWWENQRVNGSPAFSAKKSVDVTFDGAASVEPVDIDGDGDLDLVGAAELGNEIRFWKNLDGKGESWSSMTVQVGFAGARAVQAADVDHDGDMDILGVSSLGDRIYWWENTIGDGTSWTQHTIAPFFDGAYDLQPADINRDGKIDVAGASSVGNEIAWWSNINGDGLTWTSTTVATGFNGARSVRAGDIDGDGDLDLAGAAFTSDAVDWWENVNGDGSSWTPHSIRTTFNGATSVYLADIDGDGDLDVIAAANLDDLVVWFENVNGDGLSWTEHTIAAVYDAPFMVKAADVDGDGDLDVLGASSNENAITWWENVNGDGQTWARFDVDVTITAARAVAGGDLDGDGDLDLIGVSRTNDELAWWENFSDAVSPDVILLTAVSSPTNVSPIPVNAIFNEPVFGFAGGDVVTTNAAVSNFAALTSQTYTFELTPAGQGIVQALVPANVAQDDEANSNTVSSLISLIFDSIAPDGALNSGAPNPTNAAPISVTVNFSEAVAGFNGADVTVGNGSLGNFTLVNPQTYTFEITPSGQGLVTADIAAGAYQDAAGNPNATAASFSRTYDSLNPSVNMNSGAPNPTNSSPVSVSVNFSEAVSNFTAGDVVASNATVGNFAALDGQNYSFELTPSGQGLFSAQIAAGAAQDAAGNLSGAATDFQRVYDSLSPALSLSCGEPAITNAAPIFVTAQFNEPVSGFGGGDVATSNATVQNFSVLDAQNYSFELLPLGNGLLTADVGAGAAQDGAGNGSLAATQLALTYDASGPFIQDAIFIDENNNGGVDAGEHLTLVMSSSVLVTTSALSAASFYLPVAGDSLGGAGFAVADSAYNSRHIVITLGLGANLTIPGAFNPGVTGGGAASGIDLAGSLPDGVITNLAGVPAIDRGAPNVDDDGVDLGYNLLANTALIGSAGGTVAAAASPDAIYTSHALSIPPAGLPAPLQITVQPPVISLGVPGAMQIVAQDELGNPVAEIQSQQRMTLILEYRASDVDVEDGQLETALRIHQLLPAGAGYEWVEVPGVQLIDPQTKTIRLEQAVLRPADDDEEEIIAFAVLPGKTIQPTIKYIRRDDVEAKVSGGAFGVSGINEVNIYPGAEGDYTLHRINIPNYVETDENDPLRLKVELQPALLAHRASAGGQAFYSGSGAIFRVTIADALEQPVLFTDPVNLTVQFYDGTQNDYFDVTTFAGVPGPKQAMRLVCDELAGVGVDFAFFSGSVQQVDEQQCLLTAETVLGLTTADGQGVWGAVVQPALIGAEPLTTAVQCWLIYE